MAHTYSWKPVSLCQRSSIYILYKRELRGTLLISPLHVNTAALKGWKRLLQLTSWKIPSLLLIVTCQIFAILPEFLQTPC